jgi:glycosyltransferase involved in cell wall biosynthesis
MQILHINDKLEEAGGTETYIRDLIPVLQKQNIKSFLISMKLIKNNLIIKSNMKNLNWSGNTKDIYQSKFFKLIDKNTVFHVHNLKEPKIMKLLFQIAPVIRHLHTPSIFCPGNDKFWHISEEPCTVQFGFKCLINAYTKKCCNRHPKRLFKAFRNTSYEIKHAKNKYSSLIVNSSFLYDEAIKAGYDKKKINLISYFTDLTSNLDQNKSHHPQITFVGRLSNTKGVHYLIDAFSIINKRIPNAKLNIIGKGHSEKIFFKQVDKYSLNNSLKFLGWANKQMIDTYLKNSTVVAFPSIYPESFGIVGIEAMMRSRPVVGFDVGGVTDWLKNNKNGLLVKAKDTHGFAGAIIKILEDNKLGRRMGECGREMAITKFSEENHLTKLLKSYKDALAS